METGCGGGWVVVEVCGSCVVVYDGGSCVVVKDGTHMPDDSSNEVSELLHQIVSITFPSEQITPPILPGREENSLSSFEVQKFLQFWISGS